MAGGRVEGGGGLPQRLDRGTGFAVVYVGVNLRGGDVGVAQEPLGDPDILRGPQDVGPEGVAQAVGGEVRLDLRLLEPLF